MHVDTAVQAMTTKKKLGRSNAIIAGIAGNILEWYDFAIYAFLVPIMSKLFFSMTSASNAILLTLAVFGSGFVMRPLGAVVFGIWGDKLGRRSALSIVMILMGVATLLIGFLPSYSTIGMAAPLALVGLRLLQGLASGGEWGGSASFVVEFAPEGRRGFVGSWQVNGVVIGILLGSAVVSLISESISVADMESWGWRLPFLFGGLVALVGLIIRLQLGETPSFEKAKLAGKVDGAPLSQVFKRNLPTIALVFCVTIVQSIASWLLLTYTVTFMTTVVRVPLHSALWMNTLGLLLAIILVPAFGALSDRVGRKIPMMLGCLLLFVGAIPAFSIIVGSNTSLATLAHLALVASMCLFLGPMSAALVELFPTSVRVTGVSIAYNLAQTIFGGFAPFIAQLLVQRTGWAAAPSCYLMAGAAISLIALLGAPETAYSPLR